MSVFIARDFRVSLLPNKDMGVSPINSLKVSLNGSLLGSVVIPSLRPRTGSFINVKVIIDNKIPGNPTPRW